MSDKVNRFILGCRYWVVVVVFCCFFVLFCFVLFWGGLFPELSSFWCSHFCYLIQNMSYKALRKEMKPENRTKLYDSVQKPKTN